MWKDHKINKTKKEVELEKATVLAEYLITCLTDPKGTCK